MPERRLKRNIVGLEAELAERGRIKIGERGDKYPRHFDYFVITTMVRGKDNNNNFVKDEELHKALAEKGFPEPLTAIPVRLLFNESPDRPSLNFSSGYGVWDQAKKTWWCNGDGESAQRLQDTGELTWINCPCPLLGDKCKIKSRLRVVIDGAPTLGGVWTFMCASWNSTRAITAALRDLCMWTGGHIAGLPLRLVTRPKTVYPKNAPPSRISVVSLEFAGDMEQLRIEATKAMQLQVGYEKQLAEFEKQISEADEEIIPAEDAPEFYPEPDPLKSMRDFVNESRAVDGESPLEPAGPKSRRISKQPEQQSPAPEKPAPPPPPPLLAPSSHGAQALKQVKAEDADGAYEEEESPF